jgi:ATP-binding cassette subfamily C protein
MLQVYDRVLGSRSEETLVALVLLVVFLYAMMGILDWIRGRVTSRIAARFQSRLDRRVFEAVLDYTAQREKGGGAVPHNTALRDLESVRQFIASPVLTALFDLPFTPLFLAAIFLFHFELGLLAVLGGLVLIAVTVANSLTTRRPQLEAMRDSQIAERWADHIQRDAETVRSLGMRGAAFERWIEARRSALAKGISATDMTGGYTTMTKTWRLFLQSAMLGLGAWLVLRGELTPGAMIAASILLGRALAPIELVVGQWAMVNRAMRAWGTLSELLGRTRPTPPKTALPRPEARLDVESLTVIPPGEQAATLRMLSFTLPPGNAMGVIGASGAGKSTLARALTGVWPAAGGRVRLGRAAIDQYEPDVLGHLIGYLPQTVTLFEGTIAQNIARLAEQPDPQAVVAAAKKAAAHEMIVELPDGYDTRLEAGGGRLSGGQIQRIGLARALYGDPVLLVLDEPNSNLDNAGNEALNRAIREAKADQRSVIIMAHRPAAIKECDLLLILDGGMRRAFGPRDEVMAENVQNYREIAAARGRGGVS